jgi:hypothetical protein
MSRETVWRSMYSLMSKRRNSTPSDLRELLGELGLADARGAREEEAADGLLARAQPERGRA